LNPIDSGCGGECEVGYLMLASVAP
jgi:hypothetical protein